MCFICKLFSFHKTMAIRTMKSDDNNAPETGNKTSGMIQPQQMPATPPPTIQRSFGQSPAALTIPNTTDPVFVRLTPQPEKDRGVGIGGQVLNSNSTNDEEGFTAAYAEDLSPWFKDDKWATSSWLTRESTPMRASSSSNYELFVTDNLRWRYLRLETDFRSALNNFYNSPYFDKVVARRIISLLQSAQTALDQTSCDQMNVQSILDLAEENIPWIFPPHYVKSYAASLIADLKSQHNMWGVFLENELNRDNQTLGGLRAAINLVNEKTNRKDRDNQVSNSLQIDRLRMLINYGLIVLLVMLVGLPLFLYDKSSDVIAKTFLGSSYIAKGWQWISVVCFAAIGAIASFLSGLLQIRSSHVTLGEFRESMIQFKLRPIVGALIASLAGVLLITKVSGVSVDGVGGFILIIFICGFSERYFLNLFKISDDAYAPAAPIQPPSVDIPSDAAPAPAQAAEPTAVKPRKAVDNISDVNTRKL